MSTPAPTTPPTTRDEAPEPGERVLRDAREQPEADALLDDHRRRAGEALCREVGEAAGGRGHPGLAEQVVGVGPDEREQDRGAHLLLPQVVPADGGDGGGHPGGEQVERQDVDGQRDRQRDEPAEAGDEALDAAPDEVAADDRVHRGVLVATAGPQGVVGHLLRGVEPALAVDAEVEHVLDEPNRLVAQGPVLLGPLGGSIEGGACVLDRVGHAVSCAACCHVAGPPVGFG